MTTLTDLEVSRSNTINIGNYEFIRPMLSIKVKDIPIEMIANVYPKLSELLDGVYEIEIANLYANSKEIKRDGINKFVTSIIEQDFDKFNKNVEILLSDINNLCKTFDNESTDNNSNKKF